MKVKSEGRVTSFADDTVVIYSSKKWCETKKIAERDLSKLKHWFEYELLTTNASKTVFVAFSCNVNGQPNFEDTKINESGSVKYLGITVT